MKLLYITVLVWFLGQSDGFNVFSSIMDTVNETVGAVGSIGNFVEGTGLGLLKLLPQPQDLFKLSKQLLIGMPEKAVFKLVGEVCAFFLDAQTIFPKTTPDVGAMGLSLYTSCKRISFPLIHAEQILQSADFYPHKKVAVFITGWLTHSDEDYVGNLANAFNCRGDYNFMVLNSSGAIDTLYSWSAMNTESIGQYLALCLKELVRYVNVKNIHLIGHSLGAHIAGYTGEYFTKITGLNISRITGLDPANPCFNEGQSLYGLQRGNALFVDVIHTNPGVLGKPTPVGDADFFPGGLNPLQPGCIALGCSHTRAIEYFTETVYPGNERNFLGVRCTSLKRLERGFCKGNQFPMGLFVPYNLKGNYFMSVNSFSPYGVNYDEKVPIQQNCTLCL